MQGKNICFHRNEQSRMRIGKLSENGLTAHHCYIGLICDAARRTDNVLKLAALHTF